jgi:hypothetical protein
VARSGWTIATLREHILALIVEKDLRDQQRFEAQSSAIAAALLAAEKAVTKAEVATERRFEGVNEFRQALSDQTASFITRVEWEAQRKAEDERVRTLSARVDRTEGRTGGVTGLWGYLVAAAAVIVAVVSLITR